MIPFLKAAGLIAAALSALPAIAAAQPAAPRQCFFQRNLNSWKEVGDRQVNLRVGVRDIYQIELNAPCLNLRWSERLGIENRGSSSVCTGGASSSNAAKPSRACAFTARSSVDRLAGRASSSCRASAIAPVRSSASARSSFSSSLSGSPATA